MPDALRQCAHHADLGPRHHAGRPAPGPSDRDGNVGEDRRRRGRLRYAAATAPAIRVELREGETQAIPPWRRPRGRAVGCRALRRRVLRRGPWRPIPTGVRRSQGRAPRADGRRAAIRHAGPGSSAPNAARCSTAESHRVDARPRGHQVMGLATAWSETGGPASSHSRRADGRPSRREAGHGRLWRRRTRDDRGGKRRITQDHRDRGPSCKSQAGVNFGIGLIDCALRADPAPLEAAIAAQPATGLGELRGLLVMGGPGPRRRHHHRHSGSTTPSWHDGPPMPGARSWSPAEPRERSRPTRASARWRCSSPCSTLSTCRCSPPGGSPPGADWPPFWSPGRPVYGWERRFAACPESLISDQARQALLRASGADTAVTRPFDVARQISMAGRIPRTRAPQRLHQPVVRPRGATRPRPRCTRRFGGWHCHPRRRTGTGQHGPRSRHSCRIAQRRSYHRAAASTRPRFCDHGLTQSSPAVSCCPAESRRLTRISERRRFALDLRAPTRRSRSRRVSGDPRRG